MCHKSRLFLELLSACNQMNFSSYRCILYSDEENLKDNLSVLLDKGFIQLYIESLFYPFFYFSCKKS